MAAKMLKNIGRQDSRGMNMIVAISEALFGNQGADGTTHTSSTYLIVHYVLRLIILILCLVGCFAQIGTIVRIYFSYPAIVFVDLHQMEKLLLPAFTISYIGGLLSMWLGFSLFGFYGLSERSIVRLANYCLRRRKRRASRVPLPERKQKSRSPRIPRLSGIHNLVADAKTTKVQDVLDRGGQTLLTKQLQMLQQNEHEK